MPDEEMFDEYLDCAGNRRRFRLTLYADSRFLQAIELRDGDPVGLRFVLPVRDGEIPPWGEMRRRIQERLSERHIVRDEAWRLQLLRDLIRGQLTEREDGVTPSLRVDDLVLTWEELGKLLMPSVGFGLRVEVHEPGDG
jgi:hypothetical protein